VCVLLESLTVASVYSTIFITHRKYSAHALTHSLVSKRIRVSKRTSK